MKVKYEQVYDGEAIEIPSIPNLVAQRNWNVACCDCGLVHTVIFEYAKIPGRRGKKLTITVNVNQGRTKTLRKNKEHKCQPKPSAK